MSEYCAECNQEISGMAVCASLCTVEDEDNGDYTVDVSCFEDWYCFECFPPEE